jgi:hypothetical protein
MKTLLCQSIVSLCCILLTNTLLAVPFLEPVRFLEIPPANNPIVMDGIADSYYSDIQSTSLFESNDPGSTGNNADYTLTFRVCYDAQKLYILANVLDDIASQIPNTAGSNPWTWDNIQVFLSLDTSNYTISWDTNTNFVQFNRGVDSVQYPGRTSREDFDLFWANSVDGWILEAGIPWTAILSYSQVPEDIELYYGTINGFDVQGTDSDVNAPDSWECRTQWDDDPPYSDTGDESIFLERNRFGIMQLASGLSHRYLPDNPTTLIYPNPASDEIGFKAIEPGSDLAIYSLLGIKVLEKKSVTGDEKFDIARLKPGLYNLLINGGYAGRFVKE